MSETPTPAQITLPNVLKVVRNPGDANAISLMIDGVPFPWMFSAEEGAQISVSGGDTPGVTIKLVARRIVVEDAIYGEVILGDHSHDEDHDHEPQDEPVLATVKPAPRKSAPAKKAAASRRKTSAKSA